MASRKKKRGQGNWFKQNAKLIILNIVLIACAIIMGFALFNHFSLNRVVLTVNNHEFSKADYMIYLYSVKLDRFGPGNTNLNSATLESIMPDTELTVEQALKDQTLTELKTAAIIKRIAHEHNVVLSDDNRLALVAEKDKFIASLGGRREFSRMLRDNRTTEAAYDRMAETDKLFRLTVQELYGEGSGNDLTADERRQARDYFHREYVRLRQIVISKFDEDFNQLLPRPEREGRRALIYRIRTEINNDNFDELIELYSDVKPSDSAPYDLYYKTVNVIEEVREGIKEVDIGGISDVIETNQAFYIVQKLPLEDTQLEEIYDTKRQEKLLIRISRLLREVNVTYHNAFSSLRIR